MNNGVHGFLTRIFSQFGLRVVWRD